MVSNPEKDRILNQEAITCAKSLKGPETPVALAATTTTSTPQAVTAAADDGRRQLSVDSEISGKFQSEKLKTGVKRVSAGRSVSGCRAGLLPPGWFSGRRNVPVHTGHGAEDSGQGDSRGQNHGRSRHRKVAGA